MKRIIPLIFISITLLTACQPAPSTPTPTETPPPGQYEHPGDYQVFMQLGDVERSFWLHIPPGYQPGTSAPLVFNIHGRTDTAEHQQEMTQFNAKADQAGFIVISPQAEDDPPTWWGVVPNEVGQPDLDFFAAMLAYTQEELDPARIYATGLSNGGGMANRLACDLAEQIAAIAPVAGTYYYWEECSPARPVSVLAFHGLNDEIAPYEGTNLEDYVNLPALPVWAADWAARNQCAAEPVHTTSGGVITTDAWRECADGAGVTLYSLAMDRHHWPTTTFGGDPFDPTTVNDLIWAFFEAHPMP